MNNVTSELRQSGQLFYEKVMNEVTGHFFDLVQVRDVNKVIGWSQYFSWLEQEVPEFGDLAFVEGWSEAQCLQFIRAANFASIIAEVDKLFLTPTEYGTANDGREVAFQLVPLARQSVLAALQISLIESGIEPSRIDDFLEWRRSGEFDRNVRRKVFQDCVIDRKDFPSRTPSAAVA